jgi:hypothetical protein
VVALEGYGVVVAKKVQRVKRRPDEVDVVAGVGPRSGPRTSSGLERR